MGWGMSCGAPASSRCSSAPARSCIGAKRAKSLILNRSSASGLRSRNSGRPSSNSARCSRRGKTCCRRRGPPNSQNCITRWRRSPFDELLPQVEQALGRSPFEVFDDLEREPFAAASIAQVHRAKLPNGAAVILKIRRPGIEAKIHADLRILTHLAHLVEQEMPEARRYLPVQVVSQLRRSLERELDLSVEARNTERFAHNFAARSRHPCPPRLRPVDEPRDECAGADHRHPRE